jgi:hypothetical protein
LTSLYADDTDCGDAPLTVSTDKAVDTKLALSGLAKRIVSGELSVNVNKKVTSLITQFPNADQTVLRLGAWIIVCKTIRDSKSISEPDKVKLYLSSVKELLPQPAPQLVDAPAAQLSRRLPTTADSKTRQPHGQKMSVASSAGEIDLLAVKTDEGSDGWALRYLPSSIPDRDLKDQYFVIVKSVKSEDEGKTAIAKLRHSFPKYDFALYAPYEGNPWWGIMMAAWVPKSDAQQVLKVAKTEVSPDSYIWHF